MDAAAQEPLGGAKFFQPMDEVFEQFVQGVGPAVGETSPEMGPHALVGVELGRIGREGLQAQTGEAAAELPDGPPLVGREVVPHDDQVAAQVAEQMPQELRDLRLLDVLRVKAPVEPQVPAPGADREARDDRYPLPAEAVPEDRGPAPGPPGLARGGGQQEARLVEEDEVGAQPGGVFFIRGHSLRFHRSIAASSLSSARRSGFWWLQPSECMRRPTWSRW